MANQAILKQKFKTRCHSDGFGYGPSRWHWGDAKILAEMPEQKILILTSF